MNLDKWQKTVELLAELYGAAAASIVELRGARFEVVCTSGGGRNALDDACAAFPVNIESYCKRILETGDMLYVRQGDRDPHWRDKPPVRQANVISYLGFPIRRPDRSFYGTICVKHDKGTDYSDIFVRTLEQFRDLVEADLALRDQQRALERLAYTDAPTGCANRRGLKQFVERASRFDRLSWGVLYFDLDNLKVTNDRFGHDHGDAAIKLMGQTLKEHTRSDDVVARVGGDEFVLVARLQCEAEVEVMRHRVVDVFERRCRDVPQLSLMGVSVGTLYFDGEHSALDFDELLKGADAKMYADKRARKSARGSVSSEGLAASPS